MYAKKAIVLLKCIIFCVHCDLLKNVVCGGPRKSAVNLRCIEQKGCQRFSLCDFFNTDLIPNFYYEKYNIIVGRKAAEKSGLLSVFDATIFEDNESKLATHMTAAGLLTQYSDATRMVCAGAMK